MPEHKVKKHKSHKKKSHKKKSKKGAYSKAMIEASKQWKKYNGNLTWLEFVKKIYKSLKGK